MLLSVYHHLNQTVNKVPGVLHDKYVGDVAAGVPERVQSELLASHSISIDHKVPDESVHPVEEEQSHESGDNHGPGSSMVMEDEYP